MRRLFVVLALLAAGVVGLGFYRGWWAVGSAGTDDKAGVTVTVDKDKLRTDKDRAVDRAQLADHHPKVDAVPTTRPSAD